MKYTPSPLFLIFILLVISGFLSVCQACEEDKSFGCEPFVTCWPAEGGWDWIGEKK